MTADPQAATEVCAYCHSLFPAKRRGIHAQRFCRKQCRSAYDREVGLVAKVISVRPLLRNQNSMVLRAADLRVLGFRPGDSVRIIREPEAT